MILNIAGKNHILNTNFITALNYRSVFRQSVIDCAEDHELIGLLWCGEGKPDTFEAYVKQVVQDKDIIDKCLLFKTALIDPGEVDSKTKKAEHPERFNFELGIIRLLNICNIPFECVHYCSVKDIFELLPENKDKEEKQRLMTDEEITEMYWK